EIAFWRDEAAFFYALVVKKTLKQVPVKAKESIEKIEQELINITGGELDEIQVEVEQHERFLSILLDSKRRNETTYREKHRQLMQKIRQFETRFKSLKKEVFGLAEQIQEN